MDLITVSENLAQFSKQLSILQDYITIKFGLDFQEFYKTRSKEDDDVGDAFENVSDLNLVVARTSGNNSTSAQSRASRAQRNSQTNMTTRLQNTIPSESMEVLLSTVDMKTEDDFFNEMDECSDDNIDNDGDDPLDPDFDVERIGTFQEDSNFSTHEEDPEGHHTDHEHDVSCKRRSCGRKRKLMRMKKKQPRPDFDSSKKRVEIETTTPGLKVYPSVRGKGNYSVIYEGYMYTFSKNGSDKRIFRCTKEYSHCCKGRIHLSWDYKTVLCETFGQHNHSSNPAEGDVKYAMWKMKVRASETEEPVAEIVSSELAQVAANCKDFLPRLSSIQRAARHARATKSRGQMSDLKELLESTPTSSQFLSSPGEEFLRPQGQDSLILGNASSEPNQGKNEFS